MIASKILFLAGTIVSSVLAQADPPMVEFDCSGIPNLCANMCWGAYCTDNGDGAFGATLTYDNASPTTTDARYSDICVKPTNGNRCNNGPPDANSCDEYPFKTTSDSDIEDGVSKCVPATENSSQGGTLGNFYKTLDTSNGPVQFIISFGNPGAASYCEYPPTCDNADQTIYQNGAPAKPPSVPPTKKRYYYMSESGKEILSPIELKAGKKFMSTRRNETIVRDGQFERRGEFYLVEDVISYHLFTL